MMVRIAVEAKKAFPKQERNPKSGQEINHEDS